MIATIRSDFPISAQQAWDLVKRSDTLVYICRGLLSFEGKNIFPEYWDEGASVETKLRFFGLIPAWKHKLYFEKVSDSDRVILTREQGGLVRTWNHKITLSDSGPSTCTYVDEIEIEAGLFTPVVWLYANLFYRYRQARWKRLIANTANGHGSI